MVGGISAVSPYVGTSYRYMGYGRSNGAQQGMDVQGAGALGRSHAAAGVQASRSAGSASGIQGAQSSAEQGEQSAAGVSGVQNGKNVGSVFGVQANLGVGAAMAAGRPASPGTPVEPVKPVSAVETNAPRGIGYMIPFLREGMDPAELAVRMRIKYADPAGPGTGTQAENGVGKNLEDAGLASPGSSSAELGADAVQKTTEEGECQTCKERKYQDGSDDAGVSFKTPTRIAPEQAASAVRGHEMEHVVRERAAAAREDRRVISQSVSIHTAICPECGTAYISGGTTRTTTAANPKTEQPKRQTEDGDSVAA